MVEEYSNETEAITQSQVQEMLDVVRSESSATAIFIVNDGGMIIYESGDLGVDHVALAALLSASFAATMEIANLVDEKNFSKLTQQGKNLNLYICKVGTSHIIITVFGRDTNLGLVKLYIERAADLLTDILDAQVSLNETQQIQEPETPEAAMVEQSDPQVDEILEEINSEQSDEEAVSETDPQDEVEVVSAEVNDIIEEEADEKLTDITESESTTPPAAEGENQEEDLPDWMSEEE